VGQLRSLQRPAVPTEQEELEQLSSSSIGQELTSESTLPAQPNEEVAGTPEELVSFFEACHIKDMAVGTYAAIPKSQRQQWKIQYTQGRGGRKDGRSTVRPSSRHAMNAGATVVKSDRPPLSFRERAATTAAADASTSGLSR